MTVTWVCALCEDHPILYDGAPRNGQEAFVEHCHVIHPDTLTDRGVLACEVSLIRAKDWPDRYENTYRLTLPDGRLLAEARVLEEREPDDPMRGYP